MDFFGLLVDFYYFLLLAKVTHLICKGKIKKRNCFFWYLYITSQNQYLRLFYLYYF